MGRSARLQRIFQQFKAILPPEHFALQHIDRGAEHVGEFRDRCGIGEIELVAPALRFDHPVALPHRVASSGAAAGL
jgi:hypothetical protein